MMPLKAMDKPKYRVYNSLIDKDKSLDQIFEEARKRFTTNNENADDNFDGVQKKRENKVEKKMRLKEE